MPKDLVQNPDFGKPDKPNAPTHIWVERPNTPPAFTPNVEGAGNAAGALLAPFLVVLLALFFYPLTSAFVLATWFFMERFADATVGRANFKLYVAIIAIPTLVVAWILMRTDQRLGEWRPYRWTRHAARCLIVGIMFNLGTRAAMNLPQNPTVGRFVSDTFSNGTLLIATLGAMIVAHLFFWLATGMRSNWHRWLRILRLRSARFND
jgi:hypothetical protein